MLHAHETFCQALVQSADQIANKYNACCCWSRSWTASVFPSFSTVVVAYFFGPLCMCEQIITSYNRQCLSDDDCWRLPELFCSLLCMMVIHNDIYTHKSSFSVCDVIQAWHMLSSCVHLSVCRSLCSSVTRQYCLRSAEHRIMQAIPHDRPGTLVFQQHSKGVTLTEYQMQTL